MIDTPLLVNTLLHLTPVLYGVALFDYLLVFVSDDVLVRRLARPLLVTAFTVNFFYLLSYTLYFQHVPLVTVFQMLGAVGFALCATYLWVESRTRTPYTGPFILFLVVVFQIINAEFPRFETSVPELLQSKFFSFHVTAAVLGYSALSIAAVYGLLYLLLYHQMRGKRFGLVFRRLPSLDTLDRMNFHAMAVGLTFLTLGVVLGIVWSVRLPEGSGLDAKLWTAVVTLIIYGAVILARQYSSWRGPRLAYSSIIGFLVVLFSVFGVNFFLTDFHGFVG